MINLNVVKPFFSSSSSRPVFKVKPRSSDKPRNILIINMKYVILPTWYLNRITKFIYDTNDIAAIRLK